LWRIIRNPRNKSDLAPLALASGLILDIKHRVPPSDALDAGLVLALGVEQLFAEFAVVSVRGGLFDDDLLPVVADLVDDPFRALAEFEVVEGLDAFGIYGDSTGVRLVWR
jgi:hypothetical protein